MNLTSADELADEISKSVDVVIIANSNASFIKNGNWNFLSNLTGLEHLTFMNNEISNMSEFKSRYVANLDNLDHLTIGRNNLNIFPVEKFTALTRLVYLSLECNQLQTLGKGRWNLPLLETLNLFSNQITSVRATQLHGLVNLRQLNMSKNRITYFALKVLDSLGMLNFLDLSFNQLLHFSEYNVVHTNLQTINLRNNMFKMLDPLAVAGIKVLRFITISENDIEEPPYTRYEINATSVTNLSFRKNKIEKLSPLFFDNFPRITSLSLSNNKIRHIANDSFRSVSNLVILSMEFNEIETIPENLFQHLQNISFIYIAHNRIKTLAPGILKSLPKFTEVSLLYNPIVCNCSNVLLAKWLDGSMMSPKDYPKCQYPESLQNQTLNFAKLSNNCSYHQDITEPTVLYAPGANVTTQTTHDVSKFTFLFKLTYIAATLGLTLVCYFVCLLKGRISA
ncbi:Platelet glycoprotein V [Holothuria leucospilota]|uniref:Platelet glycoprotein V n=1 Tax=Holothuria leucospilota TaxID=206669 RepID=A0A9Q1CTF6_HOLLE|nr:Platelet glycoprotein V [Holothuria leucospilota]